MRSHSAFRLAAAVSAVLVGAFVCGPAHADESGLRTATPKQARAFMAAAGLDGPARCNVVSFSRSNARWALVSETQSCGPSAGHTSVYRMTNDGHWRFLFFDMQTNGCEVFNVPEPVVQDFRPFVC